MHDIAVLSPMIVLITLKVICGQYTHINEIADQNLQLGSFSVEDQNVRMLFSIV